jgi:4-amino-4-deoxy-L-arabinose transferase-like glycosyltransferase
LSRDQNRKSPVIIVAELSTLFLIFCAGGFLRFTNLGRESLWSDELFSVSAALSLGDRPWFSYLPKFVQQLTYDDSFLTRKGADNTPPLYEGLLFVWSQIFGESDFALRSMSAIAGLLAVIVMYFGLKQVLKPFFAMAAAAMLALSPGAIFYSMEARSYSLALLFATIATVRLTRAYLARPDQGIQKSSNPNWKDIAVLVLLSYSHYTGLVVAACIAATHLILISKRTDIIKDSLKFLLVPLGLAPWLLFNVRTLEFSVSGGTSWRQYGTEEIFFGMLAPASTFLLPTIGYLPAWALLFFFSALAIRKLSSANSFREFLSKEETLSLMFFLTLTALFLYSLYSAFSAGMWHERYFAAGLPTAIISLILLTSSMKYSLFIKGIILILIVTSSFLASISSAFTYPAKEDYRGASNWITSKVGQESLIVMGWPANESFYRHYLDRDMSEIYPKPLLESVATQTEVDAVCNNSGKIARDVFFIQHQNQSKYAEFFSDCQSFKQIDYLNFNGIEVTRFMKID